MSAETLVESGSSGGGSGTQDHLRADDGGDGRDWGEWERQIGGELPGTLAMPDVGRRTSSARYAAGAMALGRYRSANTVPHVHRGPNVAAITMHAIRIQRPE